MNLKVISKESKNRIIDIINKSEKEGAKVLLDGRQSGPSDSAYKNGNFVGPTVLGDVKVKINK